MKSLLPSIVVLLAGTVAASAVSGALADSSSALKYSADGKLLFPADYREWAYVSSGLGMSYRPPSGSASGAPAFDNVFVPREAYRAFEATGHWPDKTIWVIEVRGSTSEGSINKSGHFQQDVLGYDVEVKDSNAPETWRYYNFGPKGGTEAALPKAASCFACHQKNGAVEHTFVQFYPTLLGVAKAKGTLNPSYQP